MGYTVKYKKQAIKDFKKLKQSGLAEKTKELIRTISINPYTKPYEKLISTKYYSKRINIQHRLVYEVREEEEKEIIIVQAWSHYENMR